MYPKARSNFKTLGVDDSKRLTDAKIIEIAEQIITFIPHSLLTMHNENTMRNKSRLVSS